MVRNQGKADPSRHPKGWGGLTTGGNYSRIIQIKKFPPPYPLLPKMGFRIFLTPKKSESVKFFKRIYIMSIDKREAEITELREKLSLLETREKAYSDLVAIKAKAVLRMARRLDREKKKVCNLRKRLKEKDEVLSDTILELRISKEREKELLATLDDLHTAEVSSSEKKQKKAVKTVTKKNVPSGIKVAMIKDMLGTIGEALSSGHTVVVDYGDKAAVISTKLALK